MDDNPTRLVIATDRDLLRAFADCADGEAFALLVERHGPLVLGVCRRMLAGVDADDAFQATFLVLAKKATSIRHPERLGNWLYGVAVRCARRARPNARRAKEMPMPDLPAPDSDESEWIDVRPILDAEIGRLPVKLRSALVLCELQGLDRAAAAARLAISEGTLSSRIARAKEALRRRLVRRGITLSIVGIGFVLNQAAASAAVPPGLAETAVSASVNFTAGSVAGTAAVVLAHQEIQAMFVKKLVLGATLGLASVGIVGAGLWYAPGVVSADPAAKAKADKDAIQGEWTIVSAKAPKGGDEAEVIGKPVTITADKIKFRNETGYTIDPAQKPKTIDVEVKDGPESEQGTWKGIYELAGDKLTLHIARVGADRPTTLEQKEGVESMLVVLERVKK
jgi:RNA polymerase sigma factor (sigma-70 family)